MKRNARKKQTWKNSKKQTKEKKEKKQIKKKRKKKEASKGFFTPPTRNRAAIEARKNQIFEHPSKEKEREKQGEQNLNPDP